QHREVLVRARLDTAQPGARAFGAARLVYREPGGAHAQRDQSVALSYTVTADRQASARSSNATGQAMVTNPQAAGAQPRARQMLSRGEAQQAAAVLQQAETRLQAVAAQQSSNADRERLRQQAAQVAAGRASAARATTPTASRASALENNANAYRAMGY